MQSPPKVSSHQHSKNNTQCMNSKRSTQGQRGTSTAHHEPQKSGFSNKSSQGYTFGCGSQTHQRTLSRGNNLNQTKIRSPNHTNLRSRLYPGTNQNSGKGRQNDSGKRTQRACSKSARKPPTPSNRFPNISKSRSNSRPRKRSVTPKSSHSFRNGQGKMPEKIINIQSELSSQQTGQVHGGANTNQKQNIHNNTIDFFNELQMNSTILKDQNQMHIVANESGNININDIENIQKIHSKENSPIMVQNGLTATATARLTHPSADLQQNMHFMDVNNTKQLHDDFTMSLIESHPTPNNGGTFIINEQTANEGAQMTDSSKLQKLQHHYSTSMQNMPLNSRNNYQYEFIANDEKGGILTNQVSASFPHTNTQLTNQPSLNNSSDKIPCNDYNFVKEPYVQYEQVVNAQGINPHEFINMPSSSQTGTYDSRNAMAQPNKPIIDSDEDTYPSFKNNAAPMHNTQRYQYQRGSFPGNNRTRTAKLMQSNYPTADPTAMQAPYISEVQHNNHLTNPSQVTGGPAINYYVSTANSQCGDAYMSRNTKQDSSQGQLKTNLQHVHSFPLTGMGTITSPTMQNNSVANSSGITSVNPMQGSNRNLKMPDNTTNAKIIRNCAPSLKQKSAQLLQQFRKAKQRNIGVNPALPEGVSRQNPIMNNLQMKNSEQSRSIDKKSVKEIKKIKDQSKSKSKERSRSRTGPVRTRNPNFAQTSKEFKNAQNNSKNMKYSKQSGQTKSKSPYYREGIMTQQMMSPVKAKSNKKSSIMSKSKSRRSSTSNQPNRLGSKNKYKVSFQECQRVYSMIPTNVKLNHYTSVQQRPRPISNQSRRKSLLCQKKKSMDHCRRSSIKSSSYVRSSSIGSSKKKSSYRCKSITSPNSTNNRVSQQPNKPYRYGRAIMPGMKKDQVKGKGSSCSPQKKLKKVSKSRSFSKGSKKSALSRNSLSKTRKQNAHLKRQAKANAHNRNNISPDHLANIENNYQQMQEVNNKLHNMGYSNCQIFRTQDPQSGLNLNDVSNIINQGSFLTENQDQRYLQSENNEFSGQGFQSFGRRLMNNHSTIVNDCDQSNLLPSQQNFLRDYTHTQPTQDYHKFNSQNYGNNSYLSLRDKKSVSGITIKSRKSLKSQKSRRSSKSGKSAKSGKSTKKSKKKLQFKNKGQTENNSLSKIMARQQSIGTVSNKSAISSNLMKPILVNKDGNNNSKNKLSTNSARKSTDNIVVGDGIDMVSIRDLNTLKYKEQIIQLKKDNGMLKEELKITQKYAKDIEAHFIDQIQSLISALSYKPNQTKLNTEEDMDNEQHASNESIIGTQEMLQKWINTVAQMEVKALKEAKKYKVNMAQLQVSHNYIQKENNILQKKVKRLQSLRTERSGHAQTQKLGRNKEMLRSNEKISARSGKSKGSTRSLTSKKKSRKTSSNTDIFTLFPRRESNPYSDVIAGPQAKRKARSVKRDGRNLMMMHMPVGELTDARKNVKSYIETCERLEEELENLRTTQNLSIECLKEKNIKLMEEVEDMKQKIINKDLLIENMQLKKYGQGEEDYENIIKQNEELQKGRDNFRTRYLEEREARKELEIQVKRISKECNAKIDIIRQSAAGDALQEKLRHMTGKLHQSSGSMDGINGVADPGPMIINDDDHDDNSYVMDARTTGRKKASPNPVDLDLTNDAINDREERYSKYSYNRSVK